MITVLHVSRDEKFFDWAFNALKNYTSYSNKALIITDREDYVLKYVKESEGVEFAWNKELIKECFQTGNYDIVYFHSLPFSLYDEIKYIPKNKILIWWGWGYDLYIDEGGLPPLIKKKLIKPLTWSYLLSSRLNVKFLMRYFVWLLKRPTSIKKRNEVLKRIDYFQPIVKMEYELMKKNRYFRAKEFYSKTINGLFGPTDPKDKNGNILLGNSATSWNNHLDVLNIVLAAKQKEQKIIIPLNYGNMKYKKWLLPKIKSSDVIILNDFMPPKEYFDIVNSCSYAVFGMIRQQAMGNINYALSKGIKVFLYENSVIYQNHKELGYAVYAIDEINKDSFSSSLTPQEIEQNIIASKREYERRIDIYNKCIEDIETILNKQ